MRSLRVALRCRGGPCLLRRSWRLAWELDEERPGLTRLTVTRDVDNAPNVAAATTNDAKLHEGGGGWAWILSDLKTLLESGKPPQCDPCAGRRH